MRTAWFDAIGRARVQSFHDGFIEMAVLTRYAHVGALAEQGAGNEHGLTIMACDATAFMGEIGDFDFESGHVQRCERPGQSVRAF